MNIDGVFLHYLIEELKANTEGCRINKILFVNNTDIILLLSNRRQLFISVNNNSPHIRFTKNEYIQSQKMTSFFSLLKNRLEASVISKIYQVRNDRTLVLEVIHYDELGYQEIFKLFFEIYGRNSNLILTDEKDIIIDTYKRAFPTDDEKRIIIPKVQYINDPLGKINPFITNGSLEINSFEGVSNLQFTEMSFNENQNIINQKVVPVIMESNNKFYFYCFPLKHLLSKLTFFDSLSEMLEYYFFELKNINNLNSEQTYLDNYLKKEISKCKIKLDKQEREYEEAISNLEYEKIGNLLSSNLHLIRKGDKKITVHDFYVTNEEITIELDQLLTPSKNLEHIFNKYKKAKRTIAHLEEQMEITKQDIEYYRCLLEQLNLSRSLDIKEIYEELKLKKVISKTRKSPKPNITTYQDQSGNTILVGKNNVQNNYLTHKLANKNDYFFHVQGSPGSHTILKYDRITDDGLHLAAKIAAYYSKSRFSSNVAVDYTLVKNVRKVPGTKGSFVTYTNYKTIFITPNIEEIKMYLKK